MRKTVLGPLVLGLGLLLGAALFFSQGDEGAPRVGRPPPEDSFPQSIAPEPPVVARLLAHQDGVTAIMASPEGDSIVAHHLRPGRPPERALELDRNGVIGLYAAHNGRDMAVAVDTTSSGPSTHRIQVAKRAPDGTWGVTEADLGQIARTAVLADFALDADGEAHLLVRTPAVYLVEQHGKFWSSTLLSPEISFPGIAMARDGRVHVCLQQRNQLVEWHAGTVSVIDASPGTGAWACRILVRDDGSAAALAARVPLVGATPGLPAPPDAGTYALYQRAPQADWGGRESDLLVYGLSELVASKEWPCVALLRQAQTATVATCENGELASRAEPSATLSDVAGDKDGTTYVLISTPEGPVTVTTLNILLKGAARAEDEEALGRRHAGAWVS